MPDAHVRWTPDHAQRCAALLVVCAAARALLTHPAQVRRRHGAGA
ncbi:MAG: hypothetical protein ABSC05_22865 [Candidatus Solibacter sp.]